MNEIINNQRKFAIDARTFEAFVDRAVASIDETGGKNVAVAFVSNEKMRALNRDFRGKNKTTDVLSFPFEKDDFDETDDFLGDIVISAAQAAKQSAENGLSFDEEIRQLILHGILHLCGYDHETDHGEMNARELELREKLGI